MNNRGVILWNELRVMEQTVTVKIQIKPDSQAKQMLEQAMSAYKDACNFVAGHVFETHQLKQIPLQKAVYDDLRDQFGLKSQMACNVPRTVIAKFKSDKSNTGEWIRPDFKKPFLALSFNRDFSILANDTLSIGTLDGRIKVPFSRKGFEKYFDDKCTFGGANLIKKNDKFYLCISVTYDVPDVQIEEINNVVGIDRGIRFLATTYDSQGETKFYSGKAIKQKKSCYVEVRKQLQQRKTASSRRRLKKIGNRENRWMNDVNHCLSKALVNAYPAKTMFALEDLTGIRGATEKVLKKYRYVQVSWSYHDLEQKLTYKAERKGQKVIKVDAHYTSQMCPKCGHTHKLNRDHAKHCFCCRNCGYQSNDDRIGAMNIYMRGVQFIQNYLNEQQNNNQGEQVCSDGVQSITPRCNDSQSLVGKKRSRASKPRSRATGQLQAHRL